MRDNRGDTSSGCPTRQAVSQTTICVTLVGGVRCNINTERHFIQFSLISTYPPFPSHVYFAIFARVQLQCTLFRPIANTRHGRNFLKQNSSHLQLQFTPITLPFLNICAINNEDLFSPKAEPYIPLSLTNAWRSVPQPHLLRCCGKEIRTKRYLGFYTLINTFHFVLLYFICNCSVNTTRPILRDFSVRKYE